MENIVTQALQEIGTVLRDSGVDMDTWRSDGIQKVLVLALNRAFQEGRSAGLKDVLGLFEVKGLDYVKKDRDVSYR